MLKDRTLAGGIGLLILGLGIALGLVLYISRTPPSPLPEIVNTGVDAFADSSALSGLMIFEILPTDSEARFIVGEVLRGRAQTVTGVTNEITGHIAIDYDNLATTQFTPVQILAQTLRTDNGLRDSALRDRILFTHEYPLITFTPLETRGLPASISAGDEIAFLVAGNLTIKDITQEVVFTVEATAVSAGQFTLRATSTISRADFQLNIPNVPGVANVDDTIQLEIDLTARTGEK